MFIHLFAHNNVNGGVNGKKYIILITLYLWIDFLERNDCFIIITCLDIVLVLSVISVWFSKQIIQGMIVIHITTVIASSVKRS